jgi:hypothetical protein
MFQIFSVFSWRIRWQEWSIWISIFMLYRVRTRHICEKESIFCQWINNQ